MIGAFMMTRQHISLDHPGREHDACGVGFVARLDGRPAHRVIEDALSAMTSLAHRGGLASGRGEGDGAGLLLPLPLDFLSRFWTLPSVFGFGQLFLPRDAVAEKKAMDIVREALAAHDLELKDGRDVPVRPEALGPQARAQMPHIIQILVLPRANTASVSGTASSHLPAVVSPLLEPGEELERRLYLARKHMERAAIGVPGLEDFYVASLSSRSIVYKAMLTGGRLAEFYPDLADSHFSAPFAVFHERFSTNTMPRWRLAQPFRMLAHNGEINTLQSNLTHMKIREAALSSPLFPSPDALKPVIEEDGSDSSALDNVLELLTRGGRALPHSLMMLLPEPFGRAFVMGDNKRAFYDWHAAMMEAWDGPSALVFTDGFRRVGAMLDRNALRPAQLDAVWSLPSQQKEAGEALRTGLEQLFKSADDALEHGATLLILDDARGRETGYVPLPSLLAASALHNHLIRAGKRHLCGIISENDDAWEPMHMAQLIACGADAICPRGALDDAGELGADSGASPEEARASYITALRKGLLKAMARLGISTLRSFRGGHFFECIGMNEAFAETYLTGTPVRLGSSRPDGGLGLDEFAAEFIAAQRLEKEGKIPAEPRFWNRESVRLLQRATGFSNNDASDAEAFAAFAALADAPEPAFTLRSCLELTGGSQPLPLDRVEQAEQIMTRFVGAAMSLGAISSEAHICVARACNAAGARSNSGEGGEDTARGRNEAEGDSRSRIRQVASGRFGVTLEYLVDADEIQIKIAQGAKPGEGGQLPAAKVTEEVAGLRRTMPGVTLVSPPPHHDIYSIEDLAQLIYDLRRVNPSARISVKLAAESGVGTVAVGVAKAGADGILISGHDGGTGAAPLSAVRHCGSPWELGLAEAHRALLASGLRDRIRLQTDGGLHSGRDIVIAAILGADEFGFGTALLVSSGCIMCRKCHEGRCPAGIATQDRELRRRFAGKPAHVLNYLRFVAEDVRRHLAALGLPDLASARDRIDLLTPRSATGKRALPDWTELLGLPLPSRPEQCGANGTSTPSALDQDMLDACFEIMEKGAAPRVFSAAIRNADRAVGALLSGALVRRYGMNYLESKAANGTFFRALLRGSAGQSLGAFLAPGVEITVEGDANDYAGKGLCGGRLIVRPADAEGSGMEPGQSITGNVALYGATGGEAYFRGRAGERLAVRNSGALCVAEGAGDHACEYMTGGVVVVLGSCGYNFAAGMSGGVAFVYDRDERFQNRCNTDSVDLESVWTEEDKALLRDMLERHVRHTGSPRAEALLANWEAELPLFVKVMPLEARAALARQHTSQRHAGDVTPATEDVL